MRPLLLIFITHFTFGQKQPPITINQIINAAQNNHSVHQSTWKHTAFKKAFLNNQYSKKDTTAQGLAFMSTFLTEKEFMQFKKNLIVLDFDRDGDLDVIFNGSYSKGYESEDCDIYMNLGNKEYKMTSAGCRLDQIIETKNGTELLSYKYPCCSDYLYNFYRVITNNRDSVIVKENHLFSNSLFQSTTSNSRYSIIQIDTKTVLYISDYLEKEIEYFRGQDFGNEYGTLNQDENVVLLEIKSTQDQQKWGFIKIDFSEKITKNKDILVYYDWYYQPTHLYCWIKLD